MVSLRIQSNAVKQFVEQTSALLDRVPNLSNGMTLDCYPEYNRFPDLTLETLKENRGKAAELQKAIQVLKEDGGLPEYDKLVLDTLAYMLEYYTFPLFSPVNEEFYYLVFDVLPYTFPLCFAWEELSRYPFATREDVEKHLELASDYPRFTAQFKEKLMAQAERGIYLYRPAIDSAVATLKAFAVEPEKHPMSMRGRSGAATSSELQQEDDYYEAGKRNLLAAANFLDCTDYRNKAPESVGLTTYPGGSDYYRYLIRYHLNYDISPESLHETGKRLLNAALERQSKIRERLGFRGSHEAFVESLRGDARFFAPDSESAIRRLNDYVDKFTAALPRFFAHCIHVPCEVQRLPEQLEQGMTFGYYSPPTENQPKGIYFFNGKDIQNKCNLYGAALMAHELNPGHHFQLATVFESTEIIPLLKKSMCTCYNEGWAEYAGLLYEEAGLYADDFDAYGRLEMEKFICARLVVDTGLNALGWTLEQSQDFMVKNSFVNEKQAASEVLRYSTNIPAQCLPYRFGSLKFVEIRDKFKEALGEHYDPKQFHCLVLGAGAVPMDALERYMDAMAAKYAADGF